MQVTTNRRDRSQTDAFRFVLDVLGTGDAGGAGLQGDACKPGACALVDVCGVAVGDASCAASHR
jgi:hypothetical protein